MEVLKRSAEKYDKDEKREMDFIESKKPRLEISEVEDYNQEQSISIEDCPKESELSGKSLMSSKSNNDLKTICEDSSHVYTISYKDKYADDKQINDSEMDNDSKIPFNDSNAVSTYKKEDIKIDDNDKLNCINDDTILNAVINKKDIISEDFNDNIIPSSNNKADNTNKKNNKKNKKNLNKIINVNKHKIKKRNCKKNSNEKKKEEEKEEVEAKPVFIRKPVRLASIWEDMDSTIKQDDVREHFGKKEFRFITFPEFPQFPSMKKNRARKKQAALRGWKTKNKTAKKEEETKKKMVESLERCGLEFWWEL